MLKTNKYIERLFQEWKVYQKIIIAVDFDDTISPWKFSEQEILDTNIVYILNKAKSLGAYIVCFTACHEDRFEEIQNRFKRLNISLDAINKTPIDLPYGNNNKIYANIFLDDRAGLKQALETLENAMWKYAGYLRTNENKLLDDVA